MSYFVYLLRDSMYRIEIRILVGISFALGSVTTLGVAKIWSLFL